MNPLKLDRRSRRFYEALVDLNDTSPSDESWLEKFRLVRRIQKAEGRAVIAGWRCFYAERGGPLPLEVAELFF